MGKAELENHSNLRQIARFIHLPPHLHKTAPRPLILICNACLYCAGCRRVQCFEALPLWPVLNRDSYGLFYLAVRKKLGIAWSSSVSVCLFMQASPPFINVGHIYKCSNMCYSADSKDHQAMLKQRKAKPHSFSCYSDYLLYRSLHNIGLISFNTLCVCVCMV